MIIKGDRVTLRAIERADLGKLRDWSDDPDITMGLGDLHFPASLEHQNRWFERISEDQGSVRLAVDNSEGELIGYTGYWDINWRAGCAEHAMVIGAPETRGEGYGRDIIYASARHAFDQLRWHRLDASILATNEASLGCYKSCGFKVEGIRREHDFRRGKRVDRVVLGLLASEFDPN